MSEPKLPPLPTDAFDGDKQNTEIKFQRCKHKNATFTGSEIRCSCGAAWTGPDLHKLYKLLIS